MVHRHHRDVLLLGQSQQSGADERPTSQVERPFHFLADAVQGTRLTLIRREFAEILHRHRQFERVRDDLARDPVVGDQGGPQRLMSAYDFVEGPLEGEGVETADEPHGRGNVIGRLARLHLIEEPEPLLCE